MAAGNSSGPHGRVESSIHGGVQGILDAIGYAETLTSAEIQVYLSLAWWEPRPMDHARRLFVKLGLDKTSQRNGVLFYVNLRRRRLAICGDTGVSSRVDERYWDQVRDQLIAELRETHPERAVARAVVRLGQDLARIFPADPDRNPDELPNRVYTTGL